MFSRRTMLAAGLAAPLLPQVSRAAESVAACRANLARLFPHSLEAARALGAQCHDGRDAEALLDRLCGPLEGRQALLTRSLPELRATIERKIRDDYAHGRTRRIDGWMLSESEVALFAVLSA